MGLAQWLVFFFLFFFLFLLFFYMQNANANANTTTTNTSKKTTPQKKQRVISLMPSLSEAICSLGECEALVGVDRYSNWPSSLQKLPQVGGGLDPNLEAIVSLHPDLVVMSPSPKIEHRLQQLGIATAHFDPQTHASVYNMLLELGKALNLPPVRAQLAWEKIAKGMAQAKNAMPAVWKGKKVYFEVSRDIYAVGTASFMGETLQTLGLINIIPAAMGAFPKINPEFVVLAQPDVMLTSNPNHHMSQRPGWGKLTPHVCVFNQQENDALVRSGPRLHEGAMAIVGCLKKIQILID